MRNIEARLVRMETQRLRTTPGLGYVFDSTEAACAAGAMGGVLIIGPVMTPDQWCEAARKQQTELTRGQTHGQH